MAVAAANVVNIPLMRQNELLSGVALQDSQGKTVGHSSVSPRYRLALPLSGQGQNLYEMTL